MSTPSLVVEGFKLFREARQGAVSVGISLVPRVILAATGLLSTILLARGLGSDGLGKYALIISISTLIMMFGDLGIGQTAVRFSSRAFSLQDEPLHIRIMQWAFRVRVVIVGTAAIAAIVILPGVVQSVWRVPDILYLCFLSVATGVLTSISMIPAVYYQSQKRYGMYALVQSAPSVVLLIGLLIMAVLHFWTLDLVVWVALAGVAVSVLIFSQVIPASIFSWTIEKTGSMRQDIRTLFRAPHAQGSALEELNPNRFAKYMFVASIIYSVTAKCDIWIMGSMLDSSQIGWYHVANRFCLPLIFLLEALNVVLWPKLSGFKRVEEALPFVKNFTKLFGLLSVLSLLYVFFAPLATTFFFGDQYESSVNLARLLCFRYSISILVSPIWIFGYSLGLEKQYWWVATIQFAVVVAINLFLLPTLGVLAAAIAWVIHEIIAAVFIVFFVVMRVAKHQKPTQTADKG